MAEIPIIPSPEDTGEIKDYIDYQRQLNDVIKRRASLYEEIGYLDANLEKRATRRLKEEQNLLKASDKLNESKRYYENQLKSTDKVQRDYAKEMIESINEEIEANKKRIELLKDMSKYEAEVALEKHKQATKWSDFMGKIGSEQFGIKNKEYALTKSIGEELMKQPLGMKKYAGWIAVAIVLLKGAYDLFLKFDKAAWDFRKALGMTREDMRGIRKTVEEVSIQYAHIGVTADMAYKSVQALGKEMGSVFTVSSDLIRNVSVMSAQLGVSQENSAGFLRNMAAISKSTMQAQQDTMYMAANMARAAGVPLNEVMGDIAKASSKTLTMMSRWPNTVLRTAIEARRMGTTIGDMARSSRSILDFQESVNAEMDASVLLGRSINLQRARELAYRRDLEGSTREILRITKQIDFENLDVFQQEAFAKATGRSVEELMKMVQAERQWEKARQDPNLKGKIEDYEKLRKSNEEIARAAAKNYENELLRRSNQERITAISQKWSQIMMKLQQYLLPLIDNVLGFIANNLEGITVTAGAFLMFGKQIGKVFSWIGKEISAFGKQHKWAWVKWVGARMKEFGNFISAASARFRIFASMGQTVIDFFGKIWKYAGRIFTVFRGTGSALSGIWGWVGRIGKLLGRFLIPLTFAWNIYKQFAESWDKLTSGKMGFFESVGNAFIMIFKALFNTLDDLLFGIPTKLLKGIFGITGSLGDAIIGGLDKAFKYLADWWFGNSPSKVGLMILNGISSMGVMLFDAITGPFRKGLAWIADKVPGMGKVAEKLRGGLTGMVEPVEKRATAAYVPAVTITPEGTKVAGQVQQAQKAEGDKKGEEQNNALLLQNILDGINKLNANLEAGKIGFYVDGQLLSATLARQTEFRGGYGVNKV